ncbi:MAG: 5-formyltetrahydrofolate cyclo-ligase, partial [Megasphaera micronuciformis]|nr:5-formyltetrahydrofolate cyclo-ligase [Megasphaera micronuciformis]
SQVVAVAFAAQIVEHVPMEAHDQTVCRIVTEKEIIHVS